MRLVKTVNEVPSLSFRWQSYENKTAICGATWQLRFPRKQHESNTTYIGLFHQRPSLNTGLLTFRIELYLPSTGCMQEDKNTPLLQGIGPRVPSQTALQHKGLKKIKCNRCQFWGVFAVVQLAIPSFLDTTLLTHKNITSHWNFWIRLPFTAAP